LIWPNAESAVNSDPWLVANHDRIRSMQPRVLVVNFVHGLSESGARERAERLRAVLRESSRWQGYRDPEAPPFLDYRVAAIVDLTEPRGAVDRNSAQFPRTADGVGFDYAALHEMRLHEGLTLDELTERGLVNEVWLLADHTEGSAPWETVEVKRVYDWDFRPLVGFQAQAGNSGRHDAPWLGRSLRILFVNFDRGVGCAMESLGHSLERMATCGALPYYERYFREFAMLDLNRRFGLPFESLYLTDHPVSYPTPSTMRYRTGPVRRTVDDYVVAGGNVHFMPNGRRDYDLDNPAPVLSTIETWRQPGQVARPWTPSVLERYRELAPDCMGRWVVYWRQSMPGLDNTALDDEGRPMKNWWPFLFY
jgi:hypothetical protein